MDAQEYNSIFQYRFPGKGSPVAIQRRVDFNNTTNPVYVGFALSGASESDSAWYIEFLEYDSNGNYTKSTFSQKNVTWSGRSGHTYA